MIKELIFKDKRLSYKVEGRGEVLVLLHGFMEDLNMWNHFSVELAKKYTVLSIDLPGHGNSDNFSDAHTMPFVAKMVKDVLDQENIAKCVLVGHSMGGYVSLAFARLFPKMLHGLGLFHSHALSDSAEAKENRDRTIKLVEQKKSSFINSFIPSLFAPENQTKYKEQINHQIAIANAMSPKGITSALAGMKERASGLDVLTEARFPVLFILGKHDNRVLLENGIAQASLANTAQINILGDSAHMGWLEDQHKCVSIIRGFVGLSLDVASQK
ncbi:MAG: alpha/beta hydrolase [Bacteroidetes bacterium 4572_77]|nr:MAG: alpha/beta hydrolase [Bacteroidetes bacterium 4572_77]